jgi:hypothetical protein
MMSSDLLDWTQSDEISHVTVRAHLAYAFVARPVEWLARDLLAWSVFSLGSYGGCCQTTKTILAFLII